MCTCLGELSSQRRLSPYLVTKLPSCSPKLMLVSGSHTYPMFLELTKYIPISRSLLLPFHLPPVSFFSLLSPGIFSLHSLGSKWSPSLSIKVFQNPQGLFLPLSPSSFNNQYHSLPYTVVSFTDMLHLLDLKILKARTKFDFSSPAFCPQLTVCKCVLIIMMLFICDTKL